MTYFRMMVYVLVTGVLPGAGMIWAGGPSDKPSAPTIVVRWNKAALQGVRESALGPPMVSRALAIVHTCIYDAWAIYDSRATPVYTDDGLRVHGSHSENAVEKAISFAAYRCASDLMPGSVSTVFRPLMQQLGLDADDTTLDVANPQGIGNLSAKAVLTARHNDGANQTGTLSSSGVPYSDYTGYASVNLPSTVPVLPATILDVDRWQPLQYVDATGTFVTQRYLGAFGAGLRRSAWLPATSSGG